MILLRALSMGISRPWGTFVAQGLAEGEVANLDRCAQRMQTIVSHVLTLRSTAPRSLGTAGIAIGSEIPA